MPSALRNKDSTITIRVKEVTIIRIAGARDRTVMSRNICNTTVGACGCPASSKPTVKKGVEMTGSAPQQLLDAIKIRQTTSSVITCQWAKRRAEARADLELGPRLSGKKTICLIVFIKLPVKTLCIAIRCF